MRKILVVLLGLITCPVFADWHLSDDRSIVSFTTFKKEHIGENHTFDKVSASLKEDGVLQVSVDIASVNTNIEIRNERMKNYLFDTTNFSHAFFNSKLNMAQLASLTVGSSEVLTVSGTIDLHGQSQQTTITVMVSKLSENKLLVASMKPILIHAESFDLVKGINKLKQLASLPSITYTVPVSFVLSFNHQ